MGIATDYGILERFWMKLEDDERGIGPMNGGGMTGIERLFWLVLPYTTNIPA